MRQYHTVDRILETWARAEAAGINAMVTNNESPHVVQAVRQYLTGGGKLKWIAQVNCRQTRADAPRHRRGREDRLLGHVLPWHAGGSRLRHQGCRQRPRLVRRMPVRWACPPAWPATRPRPTSGSTRSTRPTSTPSASSTAAACTTARARSSACADVARAADCVRRISKPCIAYKIMGAGRIDPRMAFEYAFESIKPTDVVNVGMHRGDNDDMVEQNAQLVQHILCRYCTPVPPLPHLSPGSGAVDPTAYSLGALKERDAIAQGGAYSRNPGFPMQENKEPCQGEIGAATVATEPLCLLFHLPGIPAPSAPLATKLLPFVHNGTPYVVLVVRR